MQGAEILFYPTAIGWLKSEKAELGKAQHCAWETVQRGHAVANGCYVAAVNRVGIEEESEFWGQSFVANPYGEIVAKASVDEEEVLIVPCDLKAVEDFRRIWPFFRDRRIDSYQDITQALELTMSDRSLCRSRADHWHMPAEWSPQEAVWLSWPCNRDSAPETHEVLQAKFGEIAAAISRFETVRINAAGDWHERIRQSIEAQRGDMAQVELFEHPTNDVWCRDHGPIFVKHRETGALAVTDWQFNAWGGKFPPWDLDNQIPERIADTLELPRFDLADDSRRRLHRGERRRRAAHHRGGACSTRTATRTGRARRSRPRSSGCSASSPSSGSGRASKATTPTATSTTSRASSARTWC